MEAPIFDGDGPFGFAVQTGRASASDDSVTLIFKTLNDQGSALVSVHVQMVLAEAVQLLGTLKTAVEQRS